MNTKIKLTKNDLYDDSIKHIHNYGNNHMKWVIQLHQNYFTENEFENSVQLIKDELNESINGDNGLSINLIEEKRGDVDICRIYLNNYLIGEVENYMEFQDDMCVWLDYYNGFECNNLKKAVETIGYFVNTKNGFDVITKIIAISRKIIDDYKCENKTPVAIIKNNVMDINFKELKKIKPHLDFNNEEIENSIYFNKVKRIVLSNMENNFKLHMQNDDDIIKNHKDALKLMSKLTVDKYHLINKNDVYLSEKIIICANKIIQEEGYNHNGKDNHKKFILSCAYNKLTDVISKLTYKNFKNPIKNNSCIYDNNS